MGASNFQYYLTEEEKRKPYAHLYYDTPAQIPAEILDDILSGPMEEKGHFLVKI